MTIAAWALAITFTIAGQTTTEMRFGQVNSVHEKDCHAVGIQIVELEKLGPAKDVSYRCIPIMEGR